MEVTRRTFFFQHDGGSQNTEGQTTPCPGSRHAIDQRIEGDFEYFSCPGVSGEISMEKLINECNKIIEYEEDYHQADIPEIGGVVQSKYLDDIKPWSDVITLTGKDFLKTEDTMVVTASADFSMRNNLCAAMSREYHRENNEMLFKQQETLGGMALIPPAVTGVKNKYICYLVNRINENKLCSPKHFIRSLDRLRVFLKAKNIKSFSIPLVDPGRRNIRVRDLYAILHFAFVGTGIEVKLHTKYYLSIF